MTPLLPMYTLGHDFVPPAIHAGGLRYHGDSPIISALVRAGRMEAVAYPQAKTFEAAVEFARTEGKVPAPETGHAVRAAIDDAFGRWDRAHLHQYDLSGDRVVANDVDDLPEEAEHSTKVRLSTLQLGEQFSYTFDLGDSWRHLCTVEPSRIDALEVLGLEPEKPLPYWGWGSIPDQYGRDFDHDDGENEPGPDPGLADLPPLHPHWGPGR